MTEKVHGFTKDGYEAVTKDMDFFTLRTLVPILVNGQDFSEEFVGAASAAVLVGDDQTQAWLDRLVETISLRAQPIIMSKIGVSREEVSAIEDLPGVEDEGDGFDTVYTMRFAIEHHLAWEFGELLLEALDNAGGPFVWRIPTGVPGNNVSVVHSETL